MHCGVEDRLSQWRIKHPGSEGDRSRRVAVACKVSRRSGRQPPAPAEPCG